MWCVEFGAARLLPSAGSGSVPWLQILANSIRLDVQHFFLTDYSYLLLKYKYISEVNINYSKIQVSEYTLLKVFSIESFFSIFSLAIEYPFNKCTFWEHKGIDKFFIVYWVLFLLVQFWIVMYFSQVYYLTKAICLLGEMLITLNSMFYMFTSYYWCLLWVLLLLLLLSIFFIYSSAAITIAVTYWFMNLCTLKLINSVFVHWLLLHPSLGIHHCCIKNSSKLKVVLSTSLSTLCIFCLCLHSLTIA